MDLALLMKDVMIPIKAIGWNGTPMWYGVGIGMGLVHFVFSGNDCHHYSPTLTIP